MALFRVFPSIFFSPGGPGFSRCPFPFSLFVLRKGSAFSFFFIPPTPLSFPTAFFGFLFFPGRCVTPFGGPFCISGAGGPPGQPSVPGRFCFCCFYFFRGFHKFEAVCCFSFHQDGPAVFTRSASRQGLVRFFFSFSLEKLRTFFPLPVLLSTFRSPYFCVNVVFFDSNEKKGLTIVS